MQDSRNSRRRFWAPLAAAVTVGCFLAGCASPLRKGDELAAKGEWSQAVLQFRQASVEYPDNIEVRSRLQQTELKAAEYYYQRGVLARAKGDLDGAIGQFQQGLVAMPDHEKLLRALREAQTRREAHAL
ncbi:tetratricopeptide repeat protein, partial [Leptospira sp. SA-E8]|uniref:tetratricopeptide repeat protein n=1 Tax=Leptospira sp. SA-E8 TaxID=3422259 RepID=UPI003EB8A9F6